MKVSSEEKLASSTANTQKDKMGFSLCLHSRPNNKTKQTALYSISQATGTIVVEIDDPIKIILQYLLFFAFGSNNIKRAFRTVFFKPRYHLR